MSSPRTVISGSRSLNWATIPSWFSTRAAPDRYIITNGPGALAPGPFYFFARCLFEIKRRQLELRNFNLDGVGIDRRCAPFVVHDHGREHNYQQHHDDLDHHERHRAPIDLSGCNAISALAGDAIE